MARPSHVLALLLCASATAQVENGRLNVAFVVWDGMELIESMGPAHVFAFAPGMDEFTVSATRDPIKSAFVTIVPEYTFDDCPRPDVIVLPGGSIWVPLLGEPYGDWLTEHAPQARLTLSVCNSAILLADLGLLDGRQATCGPSNLDDLMLLGHDVKAFVNRRWVHDGNIITSQSYLGGLDAAIYAVRVLRGPEGERQVLDWSNYDGDLSRFDAMHAEPGIVPVSRRREIVSILMSDGVDAAVERYRQWEASGKPAYTPPLDRFAESDLFQWMAWGYERSGRVELSQKISEFKARIWPDGPRWAEPRTVASPGRVAGPPSLVDVNGDGRLDVVVPCADPAGGGGGQLAVRLGDGKGEFAAEPARATVPFPGRALWLAMGDVDEDGAIDAMVAHHDSYDVAILLGDGRGGFTEAPRRRVTMLDGSDAHTHSLAVADVNHDAHLDLLTTCPDDNAVAVMLGDGKAGFRRAPGSPFAVGSQPYEGLCVALLDGDSHPDVVVPNLWAGSVSVLLGDGMGGFRQSADAPVPVGARPGFVTVGDLNGDEAIDIVATHDDDPILDILLADRGGGWSPAPGSPLRLDQPVWEAAIADLDGDGSRDIVLGGSRDRVIVLFGDGRGRFGARTSTIATARPGPGRVRLADLNGDGTPDIIVTYYDADVVDVCFSE